MAKLDNKGLFETDELNIVEIEIPYYSNENVSHNDSNETAAAFYRNLFCNNTNKYCYGIGESAIDKIIEQIEVNDVALDKKSPEYIIASMIYINVDKPDDLVTDNGDQVVQMDEIIYDQGGFVPIKHHIDENEDVTMSYTINKNSQQLLCTGKSNSDVCQKVLNDEYTLVKGTTSIKSTIYANDEYFDKNEDEMDDFDQFFGCIDLILDAFGKILAAYKSTYEDGNRIFNSERYWIISRDLYVSTMRKIYGKYWGILCKVLDNSPRKWTIRIRNHLVSLYRKHDLVRKNNKSRRKNLYKYNNDAIETKVEFITKIKNENDDIVNSYQPYFLLEIPTKGWSGNCKDKDMMADIAHLITSHMFDSDSITIENKKEIKMLLRVFIPRLFIVPKRLKGRVKKTDKLLVSVAEAPIEIVEVTEDLKEAVESFDCDHKDIVKSRTEYLDSNGHIKRPKNAFMIYATWRRKILLSSGVQQQRVLAELGREWNALDNSKKDIFRKLADKEAIFHAKLFPHYKYTPRKRGKTDSQYDDIQPNYNTFIADSEWCIFFRMYEQLCKTFHKFVEDIKNYKNLIGYMKGYLSGYIDKTAFEQDIPRTYDLLDIKLVLGLILDISIQLERMVSNPLTMECKELFVSYNANQICFSRKRFDSYTSLMNSKAKKNRMYIIYTDALCTVEIFLHTPDFEYRLFKNCKPFKRPYNKTGNNSKQKELLSKKKEKNYIKIKEDQEFLPGPSTALSRTRPNGRPFIEKHCIMENKGFEKLYKPVVMKDRSNNKNTLYPIVHFDVNSSDSDIRRSSRKRKVVEDKDFITLN